MIIGPLMRNDQALSRSLIVPNELERNLDSADQNKTTRAMVATMYAPFGAKLVRSDSMLNNCTACH